MTKQIYMLILLIITLGGTAQNELKKNWYKGNILYQNGEFEDAAVYYQKAIDNSPQNYKTNFNLGNTFFRAKDYEKAIEQFEKIAQIAPSKLDKSWVYHNLGNSFLINNKINEAINAYKEALRLNPQDEETRYNLAFAQQLKDQQPEQDKDQEKDGENQDGDDQKEKDNEAGQDGDKTKDDKGNQSDDKDKNGENKENEGDSKDKEDGKSDQPSKYQPISKDQSKRILDAANRKEKQIQEELDKDKKVGEGKSGKTDW